MTGHDDFDRTLAGWLEADALSPAPAEGLDRIFDATRRRRPRPAWLAGLGSHWVGEAQTVGSSSGARSLSRLGLRWSTALILLLMIAALIGGAVLVGARLLQPSPLPIGRLGHLAYGLDGDIYVADWDGKNPVRIAHALPDDPAAGCGTFWGEGPMWSPDGRHFAYRSDGCAGTSDEGNVYVSDPSGHTVASFPGTGWLVSWSPDSTRVAAWVDLDKTIGIYGVDGVRQALLTMSPGCPLPGDHDPIWSPDGTSLLISPCVIPLDGRTPGRVSASDPRSHFGAAYSHDGARMAFVDYGDSMSLVIATTDGTELRALLNDTSGGPGQGSAYGNPVLSSTGDRVAFIWNPAFHGLTVDPTLDTVELRVVDVASGAVTTLTSATGAVPLDPIAFSPEGDRILYSRTDADSVTSLWSVRTDGSDAQLLVTGTGWGDWQRLTAGP